MESKGNIWETEWRIHHVEGGHDITIPFNVDIKDIGVVHKLALFFVRVGIEFGSLLAILTISNLGVGTSLLGYDYFSDSSVSNAPLIADFFLLLTIFSALIGLMAIFLVAARFIDWFHDNLSAFWEKQVLGANHDTIDTIPIAYFLKSILNYEYEVNTPNPSFTRIQILVLQFALSLIIFGASVLLFAELPNPTELPTYFENLQGGVSLFIALIATLVGRRIGAIFLTIIFLKGSLASGIYLLFFLGLSAVFLAPCIRNLDIEFKERLRKRTTDYFRYGIIDWKSALLHSVILLIIASFALGLNLRMSWEFFGRL